MWLLKNIIFCYRFESKIEILFKSNHIQTGEEEEEEEERRPGWFISLLIEQGMIAK